MLTSKTACELARNFPGVSEKDHFGSDAFYANKKIFATVWHEKNEVNVNLTSQLQQDFLEKDAEAFFPVPNAWGKKGWTTIKLKHVSKKVFTAALSAAWEKTSVVVSKAKKASKTSATRKKRL